MRGVQLFKTPEDLQKEVDMYFANEETPTLSGLSVFLGMTYKMFMEYGNRSGFAPVIEMARQRMESFIEGSSLRGNLNPTMAIFTLKNRFGWRDKSEVEHEHKGTISLSALLDAAQERIALSGGADKQAAIEALPV